VVTSRYLLWLVVLGGPATVAQAAPPTSAQCAQAERELPTQVAQWRSRFVERLKLNEGQVVDRVAVTRSLVSCWDRGINVSVLYTVRYDWAQVPGMDSFPLLRTVQPNGTAVPQPAFLSPAQLASTAEQTAVDTELMPLQLDGALMFSGAPQAEARLVEALRKRSGKPPKDVRTELAFYVPGRVPRVNGQPWMLMRATLDDAANRCGSGSLNLVTGDVQVVEGPCRVSAGGIAR